MMRLHPRRATRTLLVTLSAMTLVVPANAQRATQAPDLAALDAYIAKAARDWRIPGLAVAIVKDDSVIFAKGYGVREVGKPDAVDTGTRFAIGSTTKAMTVAALAMLVDEGKIRWDDPVIRHLPTFRMSDPYVTRELTVRDLVTHRGGLGNADGLWTVTDFSTEEIVRRVATIEPAYSLRSRFIYQNIMYAVAGEVVAAVSGISWADFVRTRIFQPLGMSVTVATLGELEGKPNVAAPHRLQRDTARVTTNTPVDPVAAAGSVWSSVGDMSKWMRFLLDSARVGGKRLLTPATYREIFTPQVVAPVDMYASLVLVKPHFFTYGLGWFLHDYQGEAVAMHTGSINGMSALIGMLPDHRVGVYVLANLDHAELRHALMYRVFDTFTGKTPRDWSTEVLAMQRPAAGAGGGAPGGQRRVADTKPSLPLERFAGNYTNATYGNATVTLKDGALQFAFNKRTGTLTHWHYDTFQVQWQDTRQQQSMVSFATDGNGGVISVRTGNITFNRAPAAR